MKIVRFQDLKGDVHYGEWIKEWSALLIEKAADEMHHVTDHVVAIDKLLAPVEPTSILCVGLNYRRHAEETGDKQERNFPNIPCCLSRRRMLWLIPATPS